MFSRQLSAVLILSSTCILSSCGGGGGGTASGTSANINTNTTTTTSANNSWVAGQFTDYAELADQCSADNTGGTLDEKLWLRSYSNDTYLWYDEIIDPNPDDYASVLDYFDILKTQALTPSGKLKDQFHFSISTEEWQQLSSSGASVGYGFSISIKQGTGIDREITITYSEPNSPASDANIIRGAKILAIDGVDVATANDQLSIDTLNNGLFPSADNQQTLFTIQDLGDDTSRDVELSAQTIVSDPVPIVNVIDRENEKIGYVVFNDHIATAQSGLYDAFNTLELKNIDDLIIDFRYNGGGYLALASQLGYMVAGDQTVGKTFEKTIFNDKYPNTNPITGRSLSPTPFYQQTVDLNGNDIVSGLELPTVNLSRVFVLTSSDTCSASEAFINGLRGIDVEVIQIGSTTCGKPYGFYATDNCDTTYFTVQFKGENDKGFGDYADGFNPSMSPTSDTDIQGCLVDDDLAHSLGNEQEGMLAAALYYRDNGQCPPISSAQGLAKINAVPAQIMASDYQVKDTRARSQFFNNRIVTR